MSGPSLFGSEILVNDDVVIVDNAPVSATSGSQDAPRVAALLDGKFVVAWEDKSQIYQGQDQSDFAIRAQIYNADGTEAGDSFQVNTTTLAEQGAPTITVLS